MGKDASEVRREIAATRARMGDTVEALSYKADVPSRLKDAVNDRIETVKGTIDDAMGTVLGPVVASVLQGVSDASERVGVALNDAQRAAAYKIADAATLTERLSAPKISAPRISAPEISLPEISVPSGTALAENPLGLALGALAVGFLAGLILPVSRYERETVGPLRDELVNRAQSISTEAIARGKRALIEKAQSVLTVA